MNTVELQKVVDLLRSDKISPSAFEMTYWQCGTSGCAVGWYCMTYPDADLKLVEIPSRYLGSDPDIQPWLKRSRCELTGFEAVAAHFDISRLDADYLFDVDAYVADTDFEECEEGCFPRVSREAVASRIAAYIANDGIYDLPDDDEEDDDDE